MVAGKPYIVGLTGGIASGKTSAADHLAALGAKVVDADAISHALTAEGGDALPAIRTRFGDGVAPGGVLDRKKLGLLVFSDLGSRRALEAILHPMVQRRMLAELDAAAQAGATHVFIVVPLLFETGMDVLCDEVWVMSLERDEQIRRVMARDQLVREQAEARVDSQMPLAEKMKRANIVVRTNRPIEQTRQELDGLYRDLKKRIG